MRAALLFLAAALLNPGAATEAMAEPRTHTIVIEAMQFSPRALEVNAGDTVIWLNKDPFPHNATASNGGFKSAEIASGGSWKFRAGKKGAFPYVCTLHPTMAARLVVK